jgi:signal peptidase II
VFLKQKFGLYSILFLIAGVIVALDQWTKWLVRTYLPYTGTWLPSGLEWLAPYARIVHWYNSGAAFGMFQNGSYIFMALAFIVIGVILYFYAHVDANDWFLRIAMAMQLAGAAGNLIDRLILSGKVTDFISIGTFPVFNVADASISVGTAVLLVGIWWREREEKRQLSVNSDQLSVNSDQLSVSDDQPSGNIESLDSKSS